VIKFVTAARIVVEFSLYFKEGVMRSH
jgi:hypothetical protein